MNQKSDVLIIGAGVVGMACAYELSKQGAQVTVIDQSEPGLGCSYGNAGWITPCFALPLPMPGMLKKSFKWLLDPMSPLHIKFTPSLLFIKWMLRFLHSMNETSARKSVAALTEISKYSLEYYSNLNTEADPSFNFEQKGLILLGQTPEGIDSVLQEIELVAEHGIPGKFLNATELKTLEPALNGNFQGGAFFPKEAHCEPFQVVQAFLNGAVRKGVKVHSGREVYDFETTGRKVKVVKTTRENFEADQIILATGSWSNGLGRKLKLDLPILGGKGYSMILNNLDCAPKIPIMIVERKVAITPREKGIRVAGTLELVDQDYSISAARVNGILEGARQCLNFSNAPQVLELWRGLRPCSPDGVPIIGFSKYYDNLLVCTGHQMLGLQSAPGTAKLASDLILRKQPAFDPKPFSATRF